MINHRLLMDTLKVSAVLLSFGLMSSGANAAPIYCSSGPSQFSVNDVTWDGSAADDCYFDDGESSAGGGNPVDPYENDWGTFTSIAKQDGSGSSSGSIAGVNFSIEGDINSTSGNWSLTWLAADPADLPLTLDFFIAFKGSNSHVSYLFEDVMFTSNPLNGSGTFEIKLTTGKTSIPALSNINFFAKVGTPVEVPEPGTIALMAVGLAGLVVARRRKTSVQ